MRVIGLCGRSGSGKSSFCKIAEAMGFEVIDCDMVYRSIVSKRTPCLNELEAYFGSDVIVNDSLDRARLAAIVFTDPAKLDALNEITHKHILKEVEELLGQLDSDASVILDAPTLFESGAYKMCDVTVCVIASDEDCLRRIMLRDGLNQEKAAQRLSNQHTNDFFASRCDVTVHNDSTQEAFFEASRAVLDKLFLCEEGN